MKAGKLFAVSALLVAAAMCGCKEKGNEMAPITETVTVKDGVVTCTPFEYYNAFRNPMKGWREFFGPGVDKKRTEYPYPYGSIIKEYMPWDMMENVESDGVDKVIAYSDHRWKNVEDQNIKVVARPYIVWTEEYEGGYEKNTYTDDPDDLNGWRWPSDFPREVRSEDDNTPSTGGYFDPRFPDRIKKLIKKLGEAWDDDPRVAYVEMGIIGEWGEHHDPDISTVFPPHYQPNHVAGRTWIPGIEKVLGDAFKEAFKNKKVMVRYAYEFNDYEFGNYWDSFAIDEEQERGFNAIKRLGDRWKTQPMGGEITWGWGSLWNKGYRSLEDCLNNDETRQLVIDQIRELHTNHLGGVTWANFKNNEFLANAGAIQKIMGYHFVLKDFSWPVRVDPGKDAKISFKVQNTGSSPFYYDWPVEISLIDPKTKEAVWRTTLISPKVSSWMPGDDYDSVTHQYRKPAEVYEIDEAIKIGDDVKPGKYAIAIAVLDPAGMLPSLRFAAINYFNGGRHPMGYIGIGEDIDGYKISATEFDDIQNDHSLHYVIDK